MLSRRRRRAHQRRQGFSPRAMRAPRPTPRFRRVHIFVGSALAHRAVKRFHTHPRPSRRDARRACVSTTMRQQHDTTRVSITGTKYRYTASDPPTLAASPTPRLRRLFLAFPLFLSAFTFAPFSPGGERERRARRRQSPRELPRPFVSSPRAFGRVSSREEFVQRPRPAPRAGLRRQVSDAIRGRRPNTRRHRQVLAKKIHERRAFRDDRNISSVGPRANARVVARERWGGRGRRRRRRRREALGRGRGRLGAPRASLRRLSATRPPFVSSWRSVGRGLFLAPGGCGVAARTRARVFSAIRRAESAAVAAAARSPRRLTRAPVRVRSTPRHRRLRVAVARIVDGFVLGASRRPGARAIRLGRVPKRAKLERLQVSAAVHEPTRGEMIEMRGDLRGVRGRGIASGTPGGVRGGRPGRATSRAFRPRGGDASAPVRGGGCRRGPGGFPVLVREFPTAAARATASPGKFPSRRPRGGGLRAGSRARDEERAVCFVSERERGGERGGRRKDPTGDEVDEDETETVSSAQLAELGFKGECARFGLGVCLARGGKGFADARDGEGGAHQENHGVGATEHLRRVRRARVGVGGAVAEERHRAHLVLEDSVARRSALQG